mmetsp:Transcript_62707/g.198000  ORF Transcript_62707/g.198000 Transcript_62707/m.198000 type:complete len:238 (+) Transcript_62707:159-872(+)
MEGRARVGDDGLHHADADPAADPMGGGGTARAPGGGAGALAGEHRGFHGGVGPGPWPDPPERQPRHAQGPGGRAQRLLSGLRLRLVRRAGALGHAATAPRLVRRQLRALLHGERPACRPPDQLLHRAGGEGYHLGRGDAGHEPRRVDLWLPPGADGLARRHGRLPHSRGPRERAVPDAPVPSVDLRRGHGAPTRHAAAGVARGRRRHLRAAADVPADAGEPARRGRPGPGPLRGRGV